MRTPWRARCGAANALAPSSAHPASAPPLLSLHRHPSWSRRHRRRRRRRCAPVCSSSRRSGLCLLRLRHCRPVRACHRAAVLPLPLCRRRRRRRRRPGLCPMLSWQRCFHGSISVPMRRPLRRGRRRSRLPSLLPSLTRRTRMITCAWFAWMLHATRHCRDARMHTRLCYAPPAWLACWRPRRRRARCAARLRHNARIAVCVSVSFPNDQGEAQALTIDQRSRAASLAPQPRPPPPGLTSSSSPRCYSVRPALHSAPAPPSPPCGATTRKEHAR